MDDRHALFLIVVADACSSAALAGLVVEVLTIDGMRYCGAPTAVVVEEPEAPDRGTLRVDGSLVAPEDVVQFVVRPPGEAASLQRR